MPRLRFLAVVLALLLVPAAGLAQSLDGGADAQAPSSAAPAGAGVLRVTVVDGTRAILPHAIVTITDAAGQETTRTVDERGVATFEGLVPGTYQVKAEAEGFRELGLPFTVRRGGNATTLQLAVGFMEQVVVSESDVDNTRDNGFNTKLTDDEIAGLSDDPDEMAEQLQMMAGPGAQIFVDGFGGGRLPPKDQIQQIRFNTNSYSAEYHEAGQVRVEVTTRPGFGGWRGMFNSGFRDESLNARNAFADERAPEQQQRYMVNFGGPLKQGRTSLSVSADGLSAYDSQTIVAETPVGPYNDQVRRPTDVYNFNVRLDQAISTTGQIRVEFQRRNDDRRNLGVGDFDLPERAYGQESIVDTLRVRNTQVIGKKMFNELRAEFRGRETTLTPTSEARTITVLDAFTSGGAGVSGVRQGREFTLADNLDFTRGKHTLRVGGLLEASWWDSTDQRNANGTYTFRTLEDFDAGLPSQFSRRFGDPEVRYSQVQLGMFIQDDFKPRKDLSLSLGLRYETQGNLDDRWNFAPRAGFTWSPRASKYNVRGGYGIFYSWLDTGLYEQTVRLDGTHQIDEIVINPAWPFPLSSESTVLPPSITRLADSLEQPTIHQASIGFDRKLNDLFSVRGDYLFMRGVSQFRSINANAPLADGLRPDPGVGNITQIESTGRSALDRLTASLDVRVPNRRVFGHLVYQLANARNSANSATALPSNSNDPDADWGPAVNDVRHRLMVMFNTPLFLGVRAGLNAQAQSGLPYTVTTGFDDNGDTVFNDRPAGVDRNSERGAAQVTMNLRLNRTFTFGAPVSGVPAGPGGMAPPPPPPSNAQRGPGGGDGPMMQVVEMGGASGRYRLDFYAQATNLLNRTNFLGYVGNMQSPFFLQPTSAMPARRIEVGASLFF
jgi:hypothetical protein